MDPEEKPLPTLREKAFKGVIWVGLSTVGSKVVSLSATLILARILTPEDFGLVAVAAIVINALYLFNDLGVGTALIHSKEDYRTTTSTAFYILPVVGFTLFAIAFLSAPYAATLLGNPAATWIIRIISLNLFISSFGVVPSMVMEKSMAYRRRFIPDFLPVVAYLIAVIVMATQFNLGAYSLAFGQVIQATLAVILAWLFARWRPFWLFSWDIAKQLLGYGKHVLGGSLLFYIGTNIDNIFVSRVAGTVALGYYALAYSLANLPATHVADVMTRVLFPSYVELNNQPLKLEKAYKSGIKLVFALVLPILAGMAALAYVGVTVILGTKWQPMVPAVMILTIYTATRALAGVTGNLFLATGRPKLIFIIGGFGLAVQVSLLWLLVYVLQLSFVGAAAAVTIGTFINGFLVYYYLQKIFKLHFLSVSGGAIRRLLPALVMFILLYGLQSELPVSVFSLIAGIIAGVLIYAAASWLFLGKRRIQELITSVRPS